MKLGVLDGQTLNPGDNPWAPLSAFGELEVHGRTPPEETVPRCRGADVVLTVEAPLDAAAFDALPGLRCVGVLGTGYDAVDVRAAGERGVPVMNSATYGDDAVAQHAMALLLELCRRPALRDQAVRAGRWSSCPDFCFWETPQTELEGKTMGIVGLGNIGRIVGRLASAFGMRVLAASARLGGGELAARAAGQGLELGYPVDYVDLDELFALSDVVSLHCPLSESTRGLVDERRLGLMKRGALLLNLARGAMLDERAVARALREGRLGGLGADVFSSEPVPLDNPLLSAPNAVLTPHMAWVTLRARRRILDIMADNLRGWLAGSPRNLVNGKWLAARPWDGVPRPKA